MAKEKPVVSISRDPFAREEIVRQVIDEVDQKPCLWCGGAPGRFRYGVARDDQNGRVDWDRKEGFCGKGCRDTYFNG